ncbi:hypothetical protein ACP26F_16435 [Franconibacter pulveris 1160]|uniref:hypothetical protein n=1 Tax=Franconibacter TaxID=1649295 RepID=UPI0004666B6A|nr:MULTISPECIES: hypothetical protein [Franconibacter]MCK1970528.1 hypothetical protein [Franconibacter sp. IITDAS19]
MKKILILMFISLLIFLGVVRIIPLKPVVIIQNDTNENLYLQADESLFGIEPAPEEVDKIMKARPDIIVPGGELKLTTSFFSVISEGYELNVGWLIGGRYAYNSTGGGGQNFLLSSKTGVCSAQLTIKPGHNNFEIINEVGGVCLKKLSPIKEKY